jgi:dienelactone hydrolase
MIPLSCSKSIDTPRFSNVPGTPDGKRTALTNLSDDTDHGSISLTIKNGEHIVNKPSIKTGRPSTIITGLMLAAFLIGSNVALADKKHKSQAPDEIGPYSIGHTTVILTDTSRNNDGSTPSTASGRFLHLDIWYPTDVKTDARILYDWNNPIYNENIDGLAYPGLPDLPEMTWDGSLSTNTIAELAPLARKGKFPLLIASHGSLVASAKNMPDTLEMLASHGYVIASIEHTGNSDAYYQGTLFNGFLGQPLVGDNPNLGSENILQRSKDVSFVIDQVLDGFLDQATGIEFTRRVDAKEIGVLGFSLGGMTSLASVAGISMQGHPADRRIKAAMMGGGSNYGLLMNSDDYANAEAALMFLGNDTGIVYDNFNEFTGAKSKYHVKIADFNHHIGGYQSSWCQDFESSMASINPDIVGQVFGTKDPDLNDAANFGFVSTFYWIYTGDRNSGVYDYCEASAFDKFSDDQLKAARFGNPSILAVRDELVSSMPLKPGASIAETTRTTNWYAVSFFNQYLKNEKGYSKYLKDSKKNQKANPLVDLEVGCFVEKPRPIDLLPTDKLTFVPFGDSGYDISLTSGAALYEVGTAVNVVNNGVAYLDTSGFSFPVPGMVDPVENLFVSKNGVITTRTTSDIGDIDDNGSPWYMRGRLLLNAQFTIGALMKNLSVSRGIDNVFAYYDADEDRMVITYLDIAAAGTTATNTLQIAIYRDGTIEIIIQELANTGTDYSPSILGTIGIAGGHTPIKDLRKMKATDFSKLRDNGSKFMKFGPEEAIFEQFYAGTENSCKGKSNKSKKSKKS